MSRQSNTNFLARLLDTVVAWQQRSRDRHLLAQMNERQRRDIGLSPATLDDENREPFWRA
jgi:uncharacterized protein YjiS (DUF1127 family)